MSFKLGEYKLYNLVGKGASGIVYKAIRIGDEGDRDEWLALKIIYPDLFNEDLSESIKKEFLLGKKASKVCKFVLKYKNVFEIKIPKKGGKWDNKWRGKKTICITSEFVEGYTITEYIKCCAATKYRIEPAHLIKFMK